MPQEAAEGRQTKGPSRRGTENRSDSGEGARPPRTAAPRPAAALPGPGAQALTSRAGRGPSFPGAGDDGELGLGRLGLSGPGGGRGLLLRGGRRGGGRGGG